MHRSPVQTAFVETTISKALGITARSKQALDQTIAALTPLPTGVAMELKNLPDNQFPYHLLPISITRSVSEATTQRFEPTPLRQRANWYYLIKNVFSAIDNTHVESAIDFKNHVHPLLTFLHDRQYDLLLAFLQGDAKYITDLKATFQYACLQEDIARWLGAALQKNRQIDFVNEKFYVATMLVSFINSIDETKGRATLSPDASQTGFLRTYTVTSATQAPTSLKSTFIDFRASHCPRLRQITSSSAPLTEIAIQCNFILLYLFRKFNKYAHGYALLDLQQYGDQKYAPSVSTQEWHDLLIKDLKALCDLDGIRRPTAERYNAVMSQHPAFSAFYQKLIQAIPFTPYLHGFTAHNRPQPQLQLGGISSAATA